MYPHGQQPTTSAASGPQFAVAAMTNSNPASSVPAMPPMILYPRMPFHQWPLQWPPLPTRVPGSMSSPHLMPMMDHMGQIMFVPQPQAAPATLHPTSRFQTCETPQPHPAPLPQESKAAQPPVRPGDHRKVVPVKVNGRRLFPCPRDGCDKMFRSRGALAYHLQSAHAGLKPFVCAVPLCGKRFTAKCSLLKHQESQHKIKVESVRAARARQQQEQRPDGTTNLSSLRTRQKQEEDHESDDPEEEADLDEEEDS